MALKIAGGAFVLVRQALTPSRSFHGIPQTRAAFIKFLPQSGRHIGAIEFPHEESRRCSLRSIARCLPATAKFLRQIVPPVHRDPDRRGADRRLQPHLLDPPDAAAHGRAARRSDAANRRAPRRPPPRPLVADHRHRTGRIERLGGQGRRARGHARISPALKLAEAAPAPAPRPRRTERRRRNRGPNRAPAEPLRRGGRAAVARATGDRRHRSIVRRAAGRRRRTVRAVASSRRPVIAEPPMVTVPDRPRPLPQADSSRSRRRAAAKPDRRNRRTRSSRRRCSPARANSARRSRRPATRSCRASGSSRCHRREGGRPVATTSR